MQLHVLESCCLVGGDGRAAGVNVPKSEYVKNLATIYKAAHASLAPGGKVVSADNLAQYRAVHALQVVWVTTTTHSTTQD